MINEKSVLGITLARGGSKRVPRKNMKDINGKPLLQYTIDEVKKSKYIDNYIVSTDDKDIENFGMYFQNSLADLYRAIINLKGAEHLKKTIKRLNLIPNIHIFDLDINIF